MQERYGVATMVLKEFKLLLDPKTTPTLYHYTSQSGLRGILGEDLLWLTHIRFLNDTSEYRNTVETFNIEVESKLKKIHPEIRKFVLRDYEAFSKQHNIFTCSFSGKRDNLSQWRAYSAEGNGYCIGFNANEIFNRCWQSSLPILIPTKCSYRSREHSNLIRKGIDRAIEIYKTSPLFLSESLKYTFCILTSVCKNSEFKDEDEYRIIFPDISEPIAPRHFRDGRTSIIPYCHLDFKQRGIKSYINEIICGPGPDPATTKLGLDILISQTPSTKGQTQHSILTANSSIPFRNWH